jgi:hypothetical protein
MSFYLQKAGREIGPLEAENIVALLQAGDCLPTDLIRREEDANGWTPASAFFPEGSWSRYDVEPTLIAPTNPLAVTIRELLNEEQDEEVARKLVYTLAARLRRGERVQAVSVQKHLVIGLVTEAVVATSDRLFIVRDLILGKDIEEIAYPDLAAISAEKELRGAVVTIETRDRRKRTIKSLPKESAEKVVRSARARKEQLSATPASQPPPLPLEAIVSDDPLARLKKLKELLDQGVITDADYEAKKREILPLI